MLDKSTESYIALLLTGYEPPLDDVEKKITRDLKLKRQQRRTRYKRLLNKYFLGRTRWQIS